MQDTKARARAVIDWIHGARTFSKKQGLENTRRLLALLGDPQRRYPSVHVAGTNGKGSVCAMIESALRGNGYKTGLYTSPYLVRYQERMRIGGQPVDDETFARLGERVQAAALALHAQDIHPTAFELGTALAFLIFAEKQVDIAVIEAGLGGRLDPTNVIEPAACVIANIGLDHMEILGDTIEQIAAEKAGIIKAQTPVALYPQQPSVLRVFEDACQRLDAPLAYVGDLPMSMTRLDAHGAAFETSIPPFGDMAVSILLPGRHQAFNAMLALTALAQLRRLGFSIDRERALLGLRQARWTGRLQWLGEHMLLDGAHNEQGAQALASYVKDFLPGRQIVLLTAMMRDKRPDACADLLAPIACRAVATQVDWPRALPAGELAALYQARGVEAIASPDIAEALRTARALAAPNGLVLVAGSLYLIGAVLSESGGS